MQANFMTLCGDHPNVINLLGWYVDVADNHDTQDDAQEPKYHLCLVMPLLDNRCVSAWVGRIYLLA